MELVMSDPVDRDALLNKRDDLLKLIDDIKRDLGGGLEANLSEQSIQLENMEVLQELLRVAASELEEVSIKLATSKLDASSG